MIIKFLKKIFKIISYGITFKVYGKIEKSISFNEDKRIKVEIVNIDKDLSYRVFNISNGRLYTDRIHDTAILIDNKIIKEPSFQLRYKDSKIYNSNINENIVFQKGTPRRKKILNGRVLSLLTGGGGNENYWHWLFDVLPRLALCEKILDINKVDFFLLPNSKKRFQQETFDLLNIAKNKIISSEYFRHIQSNELWVTDHPYVITNDSTEDMQNLPVWISKWLRSKYIRNNANDNLSLPKKIYIDRKDSSFSARNLRSIVNEEEIKNFLTKEGFKSISLGDFSFKDQVEIFSNAEAVVGLHGGGFANICFCKSGSKIIELKSQNAGKAIEHLAKTNELVYKSISCKPTKLDKNNQLGHINVSVDLLSKLIKE